MEGKKVVYEILYYVLVLGIYYLVSRDGPPLKATGYYYTYRACQTAARIIGHTGMVAERHYYREMECARG